MPPLPAPAGYRCDSSPQDIALSLCYSLMYITVALVHPTAYRQAFVDPNELQTQVKKMKANAFSLGEDEWMTGCDKLSFLMKLNLEQVAMLEACRRNTKAASEIVEGSGGAIWGRN
ncbi:hypothetical protein M422DRAFT_262687 [Sphaerobolus stellatus SS14]|uniref:Uncharacterized protein n=1 Tax=Sphaerobolus stellatus (strain SS14) TaxID=990650 RepID=A0A0C9V0G6_SPHS4|nr:hypothetical protein M422DRAFT_262687 [Sphaerobolus stellatus SS14]